MAGCLLALALVRPEPRLQARQLGSARSAAQQELERQAIRASTGQSPAQQASTSSEDTGPRSEKLAVIRAEIDRLSADLRELSTETDDILGRAGRTRTELRLQEAKLAEAREALAQTRASIERSSDRITALVSTLDQARAALRRRLIVISRFGGQAYLRLFLSIDRRAELLPALRQLRYLIRRDVLTVDRYRQAQRELEEEQAHLEQAEVEAGVWVMAEEERRSELRQLERRQRRLLDQLNARRVRLVAEVERLSVKEARLDRLMESLLDEGVDRLDGVPIQQFQAALPWPAQGRVLVEFGPQRDPRYRTTVPHNGIEIETQLDTPIEVIYPGRVLFAAPFQDLGFTVVVQHAGQVLTLYAGLTEVLVSEGDVLGLGTVIGASGARLYFEIRVQRRPENPMAWLL